MDPFICKLCFVILQSQVSFFLGHFFNQKSLYLSFRVEFYANSLVSISCNFVCIFFTGHLVYTKMHKKKTHKKKVQKKMFTRRCSQEEEHRKLTEVLLRKWKIVTKVLHVHK